MTTKLIPRCLTATFDSNRIRSLVGFGKSGDPLAHPVSLPRSLIDDAAPQCISGRTSYLQVRLAFHLYPQLIPQLFNVDEFGPPPAVTRASPWPWVAHLVSGLLSATFVPIFIRTFALFTLGFPAAPELVLLNLATNSNSPVHSAKSTPLDHPLRPCGPGSLRFGSGPLTACRHTVSGSISFPSSGFFSPFPRGTGSLSVAKSI